MGRNTIGSGSVILTADADGLLVGLKRAAQGTTDWARGVQTNLWGLSSRTQSIFAGIGAGAGGLAKSVGLGLGVGVGVQVLGALQGAAAEFPKAILGSLKDTAGQGAMAKALGLTSEQFSGMAGVAKSVGEDTREFLESLVTMGKLATDAAAGNGAVAPAAFQALGLDAQEFIKLRADEQFFQIFESLGRVDDSLTRTRLLMAAFGEDGGKYLLPLLSKTPGELRKMADGFSISGQKVEKATTAALAWAKVEQTIGSVLRDVAVDVAPNIEDMAGDLATHLKEVGPALAEIARAGAGLTKDVLIPAGAWAAEVTKGVLNIRTATDPGKPVHLARSEGGGREGDFLDQFYDALPDAREWGAGFRMVWAQQKDALGEVFGDVTQLVMRNPFRTDHADELMNTRLAPPIPAPPPKPEPPSGVISGWLADVRAVERTQAVLRGAPDIGRGLLPGLLGIGGWANALVGGGSTLMERIRAAGIGGRGPWDGTPMKDGLEGKRRFAGAVERGSREAYSIESQARYGNVGKDVQDANKENGRKLDKIKDELIDIRRDLRKFSDKVEYV